MTQELSAYTEGDVTDVAVCHRVADVLQRHYPGYRWLVGTEGPQAGTVAIKLPDEFLPPSLRGWGYLLHMHNAWDDHQIMLAGGEILERLGQARAAANEFAERLAREYGVDLQGAVLKSKA